VPAGLLDARQHPGHRPDQPDHDVRHLPGLIRAVLRAGQAAMDAEPVVGWTGADRGPCGHEHSAPGYRIPGRLRAFIEARDRDCGYPVCRRPAAGCDIDHTIPYDQDGLTCRCNLYPQCRRHHRLKQLRAWRLSQPQPGTLIWRTPAGLTYPVMPEPYAW
jgi:hypothetical protein